MILVVLFLFSIPFSAFAYLDLGSGSYFLQMLLALLFAVSLSVRTFWHRIASFFKRRKKDEGLDKQLLPNDSDGREE